MNKPLLFLLHFAGGNSYSFQFMRPQLSDFEVIVLELPGRGRRFRENLLTDFNAAALDIYEQMTARLNSSPFLIYGHSMGAYLALRICNLLESNGKFPECIIVSGNAGPGINNKKQLHLMENKMFIEEVQKLGGVPDDFSENEELLDLFEPILRADFKIAECNQLELEPAVRAPLFAVMGSMEEEVEQIENWARFTRSQFQYEILEGDHFFIHKHPKRMAEIIKYSYNHHKQTVE